MYKYTFDNLIIYRSVYEFIDSNMYVILEQDRAIIIDPHQDDEVEKLLEQNNIKAVDVLLTHEHPDHISGLPWFAKKFDTKIICHENCAKIIADKKSTRPILITFVLEEKDRLDGTNLLEKFNENYSPFSIKATQTFNDVFEYKTGEYCFKIFPIPGHSKASCCIILDDEFAFSGDSLMLDNPTITRFPGGNTKDFKNITIPYFESLDEKIMIFPGHGEIFKLKDKMEKGQLNVAIR